MPNVDADGISTAGGARAAWFEDPEGNILAIVQTLEQSEPAGTRPPSA
ncbi:MAG TPA: hypothetical protein VNS57_10420 [Steroidobacteraceae bacterium]|nr:hypothetical protein [Steroidobacteraceae bacterium]